MTLLFRPDDGISNGPDGAPSPLVERVENTVVKTVLGAQRILQEMRFDVSKLLAHVQRMHSEEPENVGNYLAYLQLIISQHLRNRAEQAMAKSA